MIRKRKEEQGEDEEEGNKLNETASSMQYMPTQDWVHNLF